MSKKRFVKVLSVVVAAVLMISTFAACGNTETPPAAGSNAGGGQAASGDVITLKVQSQDPENGATGRFLEEWAAAVEEASGGRLDINIFHGATLGPATESFNMVESGAVDIAWGLPSMTTGKFPLTDVGALPFTAEDTLQASYALWDLYDSTDYLKDEWSSVKVIVLHANCDSPLLLVDKKVESIDDLKGLSSRFIGGASTDFANLVGAIPSTMAINDIYTNLEKGVVDAAANCGWDVVDSFRLYEQAEYILDWHLNINPYFLVMNLDTYNSLPADLQAVIDEYSGYKALEYVGTKWQDIKASCMELNADKVYSLSDAEQQKAVELGEQVAQDWIASVTANGADGQGLYDAWMERVEKYEDKIAK
ncbi:MAG: TRAP transporter substrate-binding protein [Eubacterium sp.]|nr:TRAP transporter substrate-binding protein [Eubacterium sp.]